MMEEITMYRISNGLMFSSKEAAELEEQRIQVYKDIKDFKISDEIFSEFFNDNRLDFPHSLAQFTDFNFYRIKSEDELKLLVEYLHLKFDRNIRYHYNKNELIYVYFDELYFKVENDEIAFNYGEEYYSDDVELYQLIVPLSEAIKFKFKLYEDQNVKFLNEILNPHLEQLLKRI